MYFIFHDPGVKMSEKCQKKPTRIHFPEGPLKVRALQPACQQLALLSTIQHVKVLDHNSQSAKYHPPYCRLGGLWKKGVGACFYIILLLFSSFHLHPAFLSDKVHTRKEHSNNMSSTSIWIILSTHGSSKRDG